MKTLNNYRVQYNRHLQLKLSIKFDVRKTHYTFFLSFSKDIGSPVFFKTTLKMIK